MQQQGPQPAVQALAPHRPALQAVCDGRQQLQHGSRGPVRAQSSPPPRPWSPSGTCTGHDSAGSYTRACLECFVVLCSGQRLLHASQMLMLPFQSLQPALCAGGLVHNKGPGHHWHLHTSLLHIKPELSMHSLCAHLS